MMADLEKLDSRFAFEKNWLSYSYLISEAETDLLGIGGRRRQW